VTKILLAIDDSEVAKAATAAVVREFRPLESEVNVLHVVDPLRLAPPGTAFGVGPSVPADFAGPIEEWLDHAELLVSRTAKTLEAAGFRVNTSVKEGHAKSEILKFSEEWRPDVIVMASHGGKRSERFLLGSVTEAIMRHAPCSVQIVRARGSHAA
jgi:nucleotide-binding universal stress UspA family protein